VTPAAAKKKLVPIPPPSALRHHHPAKNMAKKVLAVFGATGQQGGSVIDFVLNDAELSAQYSLRAITRDVNSAKATALKHKGVEEVVQGDAEDASLLASALAGAHTVFIMTYPSFAPDAREIECDNAKRIADAAVAQGAQYLIFSTLPHISKLSKGKRTKVLNFDAKALAEEYIRTLPVKSAFYMPGFFMENFGQQPFLFPRKQEDGTYVFARNMKPESKFPYIDAVGDTGKYVGAILAEPERFEGKTLYAAAQTLSMAEVTRILAEKTGTTIVYKEISDEEFWNSLSPPLPPQFADIFVDAFRYYDDPEAFGERDCRLFEEGTKLIRGDKVTTLEEYLDKFPLSFEV